MSFPIALSKEQLKAAGDAMARLEQDAENWRALCGNLKRFELARGQDGWGREIQLVMGEPATSGSYLRYDVLQQVVAKIQDGHTAVKPGFLSTQEKAELRIRAQNLLAPGDWIGCKASAVLALLDELDSRP